MVLALIDMITEFLWVSAGEHFFDLFNNIIWGVRVFGEVVWPVVFEDLFDGDWICSHQRILWR